jgi:prefoldin subunit 5
MNIRSASSHDMATELLRRAIARVDENIARVRESLQQMQRKQQARKRELRRMTRGAK